MKRSNHHSGNREQRPLRCIDSQTLLAGDTRLRIEHAGVDYLLQITRQGKLILTK
jgi:hemin uptake protein HemP